MALLMVVIVISAVAQQDLFCCTMTRSLTLTASLQLLLLLILLREEDCCWDVCDCKELSLCDEGLVSYNLLLMTVNEYLLCLPVAPDDVVCGFDGLFPPALLLLLLLLFPEDGLTVGFPLAGKTLFWNFPSMLPGGL